MIKHRRSIFPPQYSDDSIKKEVIQQIVENANWAPTHKLSEPWRFTIYAGDGLKKLANFMADLYKKVSLEEGTFNEDKYENLKTKPLMINHHAECFHESSNVQYSDDMKQEMTYYYIDEK